MHIEEAENLRLGESKRVNHRSRLKSAGFGKLYDGLHADAPIVACMAFRQAEPLVKHTSHRTHGAVGHNRQRRLHVHSGEKASPFRSPL